MNVVNHILKLDWGPYCGDKCPGKKCRVNDSNGNRFDTWCQMKDSSWSGGCNGKYKSFFDENCQKTCGICKEEGIEYLQNKTYPL